MPWMGELAQAKALNSGRIQADGGYVVMTAKSAQDLLGTVVNNTGTPRSQTLRKDEKGQILLDGGQSGQVEVSGTWMPPAWKMDRAKQHQSHRPEDHRPR